MNITITVSAGRQQSYKYQAGPPASIRRRKLRKAEWFKIMNCIYLHMLPTNIALVLYQISKHMLKYCKLKQGNCLVNCVNYELSVCGISSKLNTWLPTFQHKANKQTTHDKERELRTNIRLLIRSLFCHMSLFLFYWASQICIPLRDLLLVFLLFV